MAFDGRFKLMIGLNHGRPARLHDRKYTVEERHFLPCAVRYLSGFTFPMFVFGACENIAGVRKCRYSAPILKPRVPADMVSMHVGTHDIINVSGAKPQSAKPT